MIDIRTHTEIDATAAEVWAVLADFDSYPDWNPFITSISGDRVVGGKLRVRIEPPGARAMRFTPTVLAVKPSQELRWLGRFLMPGLVDGRAFVPDRGAGGQSSPRDPAGTVPGHPRSTDAVDPGEDTGRIRGDEHSAQGARRARRSGSFSSLMVTARANRAE
jgi:hypothetical protein